MNRTIAIIVGLVLILSNARAQNAYKFIEPNISVSYDSALFKISQRYSNTTYESEAYDFSYAHNRTTGMIHISASPPIQYPAKELLDSLIMVDFVTMQKMVNDSISILNVDSTVRKIEDFSCVGLTSFDKIHRGYGSIVKCFHFSPDDYTEIVFISNNQILDSSYTILSRFLKGFKSYSMEAIEEEEKAIQNKYSVSVTQVKENDGKSSSTYRGIVKINETLTDSLVEVVVVASSGKQVFFPEPGQQGVIITLNDKNRGQTFKHGEAIILNSFGKRVKIPFTFSYVNNK